MLDHSTTVRKLGVLLDSDLSMVPMSKLFVRPDFTIWR